MRRWTGLVDPDCPICGGDGVLELGLAALAKHGPEVTAQAVELALEAQARTDLGRSGWDLGRAGVDIATARAGLTDCVQRLRRAGILARNNPRIRSASAAPKRLPLKARAAVAELDWATTERPMTPGFALAFHLCNLWRVPAPCLPRLRDPTTGRYVSAPRTFY